MKNVLYIVWTERNNTGIPIIDEQHRSIVATINSLYYFLQEGHGPEISASTLAIIEQYAHIHFRTEERLMTEAGYPALKEHVLMHKNLVEKSKGLSYESHMKNEPGIILKFLKEWWMSHINNEDRKYIPDLMKG